MNVMIKIDGMHCENCAARITKALENTEGVSNVSVSLENKEANLTLNDGNDLEKLKEKIEDLGFTVEEINKIIWSKFVKAVQEYELIKENDHVMVCISGGKDSFLLAKCIQELTRHGKVPFRASYVVMDPGYTEKNRKAIISNAEKLGLPITIFESDIFSVVDEINFKSPCYMCARMRRGYLYSKAKELGCNKIALGHHFNDVVETTLLSMFYGAEIKTMMPKLHSDNYPGIELIRPLFLVKEKDIISWKNSNQLTFLNCACRFTEDVTKEETASKRLEMKKLIEELKKVNPDIEHNLFKSTDNVNLNCVLGVTKDGVYHSFLEHYDD